MRKIILSNVAEGVHAGNVTKIAADVISQKYLLGKLVAEGKIAIAGENDTPIGIITDEAPDAGDIVNVALLGNCDTIKMIASGAIALGSVLVAAAGGKVKQLPTTAGTYMQVGIALNATSSDGTVECISCVPVKNVVSAA